MLHSRGKQPLADHEARFVLEELLDRSMLHDACAIHSLGPCLLAAVHSLSHTGCRRRRGRHHRRASRGGFTCAGSILQEGHLLLARSGHALGSGCLLSTLLSHKLQLRQLRNAAGMEPCRNDFSE